MLSCTFLDFNMDSLFNILIEVAVFLLLGFGYYSFQRKRIIRGETQELLYMLDELISLLNEFLDQKESESFYKNLNSFTQELEVALDESSLEKLNSSLTTYDTNGLPDSITHMITDIRQRLTFYNS